MGFNSSSALTLHASIIDAGGGHHPATESPRVICRVGNAVGRPGATSDIDKARRLIKVAAIKEDVVERFPTIGPRVTSGSDRPAPALGVAEANELAVLLAAKSSPPAVGAKLIERAASDRDPFGGTLSQADVDSVHRRAGARRHFWRSGQVAPMTAIGAAGCPLMLQTTTRRDFGLAR